MANFPLACFSMRHAIVGIVWRAVGRGNVWGEHRRLKGWKVERLEGASATIFQPSNLSAFQPSSTPSSSSQRIPHPHPRRTRLAEGDDGCGARFDAGVEE